MSIPALLGSGKEIPHCQSSWYSRSAAWKLQHWKQTFCGNLRCSFPSATSSDRIGTFRESSLLGCCFKIFRGAEGISPFSQKANYVFFFFQNHESFWLRQPSMQEQRPGWMSVSRSISRYQGIPRFALFVSRTIWGSSLSLPQRDRKKFLLNFMIFSQMFYLTLLRWTVALTDYICKTIHTAVAARQLGSRVVSGDTCVTFFFY